MSEQDVRDIVAAGPELGQFVSDYCAIFDGSGEAPPRRSDLAQEIADAWTEQAVAISAPQEIVEEVRNHVVPQIEYYLP